MCECWSLSVHPMCVRLPPVHSEVHEPIFSFSIWTHLSVCVTPNCTRVKKTAFVSAFQRHHKPQYESVWISFMRLSLRHWNQKEFSVTLWFIWLHCQGQGSFLCHGPNIKHVVRLKGWLWSCSHKNKVNCQVEIGNEKQSPPFADCLRLMKPPLFYSMAWFNPFFLSW